MDLGTRDNSLGLEMEMRFRDRVVYFMTRRTIPFCVTCVVLFCISSFGAQPANCPDSVAVHQQLTAAVNGWTTMIDDTPHRLANITFYDGPPQQGAPLIYDQRMAAAGKETATWHFLSRADRQIWVGCSYAGTAIVLTKALPRSTSTCSVTYDPRQTIVGLSVIEKIVCK
jgi:hypothetical protein